MKNIVVIFALLPLLFASCSKSSDTSVPTNGTPLRIGVATESFTSSDNGDISTRTIEEGYQTRFAAGDAIGLFVYENDAPNALVYTNVKWVFDGTTWSPATNDDKVIYANKPLLIKAYYPYKSGLTALPEATTFEVIADQTVVANYSNSDLLLAPGVTWTASIVDPQIVFVHQMALFEVIAVSPDENDVPQVITTITSVSLEASVGNGAAATTIGMRSMPDGSFRALMPAQTLATTLVIKKGDKISNYPVTGELKYGARLTYKINVTTASK